MNMNNNNNVNNLSSSLDANNSSHKLVIVDTNNNTPINSSESTDNVNEIRPEDMYTPESINMSDSGHSKYSSDINLSSRSDYITNTSESYNYSSSSAREPTTPTMISSSMSSPRQSSFQNLDILNKVFIGGLNYQTSDEALRDYFAKYGTLTDYVIIKDAQTKRSRGFGFVKYSDSYMVDELMRQRPHYLDNRRLDIKRSTPRKESDKIENHANVNRLFVGGLCDAISEDDLTNYFSQFGRIVNVMIKKPKDGNAKTRYYGFVTFDDYDPVDKIISKLLFLRR